MTPVGDPIELIVLGAGPAYTDRRGSLGAAYLLTLDHSSLLLDLGQGSFPSLAATMAPASLEAVLISHLHPDHFVDLVPLRHYLRYQLTPPARARVLGPDGLAGRLDGLLDEPGFAAEALDIETLGEGMRDIGPFRVESRLVRHTAESYAFRVTPRSGNGVGLVYSGDCGMATDLDPLIHPGDVLLVEVSFGPATVAPGAEHLNGPDVGGLAARQSPGRVLLTHLLMGFDEAETIDSVRASYGGPIEFVRPEFRTTI